MVGLKTGTDYAKVKSVEGREEWLEWRRQGIGSSDAPAIMTGEWVWRVWLSKVSHDDGGDNNAMRRGRYLERGVGQWAADELGVTLSDASRVVHPKQTWMRCTPDFILTSDSGHRVGLEVKTYRSKKGWGIEGTDQIPDRVRWQVDWQMAVCRATRWCVVVYITSSDDFWLYNIRRDRERESVLIKRCGTWWKDHVVDRKPPTLDGSNDCRQWVSEATASDSMIVRPATQEEAQMAGLYEESVLRSKQYSTFKDNYGNALRALIGKDRGVFGEGWRLTKSKTGRLTFKRGDR